MVRFIRSDDKTQESLICGHCHHRCPKWHFLANPVMPNGIDPFCYHCRVIVEKADTGYSTRSLARTARRTTDPDYARQMRNEFQAFMRDAILERDGHQCRFCEVTTHLQVHHITPVAKGGTNDNGNLVTLCMDHHRAAHKNTLSLADLRRAAAHERIKPQMRE